MTRRDDILSRVMSRIVVNPETGCWLWTGPTPGDKGRGKGYPRMSLDGQTVAVHRVIYTNLHGYIPGKKQVDHTCKQRRCVNPEHLEMVTHRCNCARRDGRK